MAAYGELYRRHVSAAQGLARQLARGPAEVDDVVADTFAKVLDLIRRGGGPQDAFRPYLLTAVRRGAYDRYRGERRSVVTDEIEAYDPGQPFIDPAVAGLERSLIARAFLSLPERWRAVLWHTEIEGAKPADVAPLLGLTANGVAALAYRAREGLRQAYLQMHLSGVARQECRPVAAKLGAYVRGGLSARESQAVSDHLDGCADCRAVYAELADVNVALRGVVAPIFLGPLAAAYLAGVSAKGGAALAWIAAKAGWIGRAPKGQQAAMAGGVAAAAAAAVALALALSGHSLPVHARHHQPAAAAPPPAAAPAPAPAPKAHVRPAPPPPAAVPVQVHVSTPRPAKKPRPGPTPPVPPPPTALSTQVAPVGALLRGSTGMLVFSVTNTGSHAVKTLSARLGLPPGVSYLGGGNLGMAAPMAAAAPGGWSCAARAAGAACTHGPLGPGATTKTYIQVAISPTAPYGAPPKVSVTSAGRTVTAQAASGVVPSGLPARFTAAGRLDTIVAGNALPQCYWWNFGQPPSSQAQVVLPGNVLWAGLYWSGTGYPSHAQLDLRGPGGGYQPVGATTVGTSDLYGQPVYQAYANVTGLVQGHGGGSWQAQVPRGGTGETDGSHGSSESGWALVVVAHDPSAPVGQAVVVDGAHVVSAADPSFSVPLNGLLPAGAVAGIQTVTWDGHDGGSRPAFSSTRQTLAANPSVQLSGGGQPYLVGVVAATTSADSTQAGPPPYHGWPGENWDGWRGGPGLLGWPDDDACGLLGHQAAAGHHGVAAAAPGQASCGPARTRPPPPPRPLAGPDPGRRQAGHVRRRPPGQRLTARPESSAPAPGQARALPAVQDRPVAWPGRRRHEPASSKCHERCRAAAGSACQPAWLAHRRPPRCRPARECPGPTSAARYKAARPRPAARRPAPRPAPRARRSLPSWPARRRPSADRTCSRAGRERSRPRLSRGGHCPASSRPGRGHRSAAPACPARRGPARGRPVPPWPATTAAGPRRRAARR